jgi:hypothetical protein
VPAAGHLIRTVVTIFGEAIEVWTGHGPIR